jgi:endonuclease/exonuclease/phosphatase (EEP) superfamily protein YafD
MADLKVAHFNVFVANTQYEKTLEKALSTRADLLSFQEVHTNWATFLEKHLAEKYPYYHIVTGNGSGEGIAVFSRYPLCHLKTIYWEDRPNIAGDIEVADSSIHFLASHTISPMNLQRYHQRKRHLQKIANYLQKQDKPILAIGDYNIVPWNRNIVQLKKQAQLADSRKGRQATFPSYLGRWGIPIDYIFHSNELNCLNFGTIQGTGSDHLGIQGAYQLKKKNG